MMELNIYVSSIIWITIYAFALRIISNYEKRNKIFVILTVFHLIIIQALRADFIGGDLGSYASHYSLMQQGGMENAMIWDFEFFYHLLVWVSVKLGITFQIFIALVSIFYLTTLGVFVYKNSRHPYISFIFFLIMGIYDFTFSALRQTISMAILIIAFQFLMKKKPVKYYVAVGIAMLFHNAAILFAFLYPLLNFKSITKVYRKIYFLIFAAILFFGQPIARVLSELYREKLLEYVSSSFVSGFGFDEVFNLLIFLAGLFFLAVYPNLKKNKRYNALLIIVSISVLIQFLSPYSYMFTRMNLVFKQFSIVFIANVYELLVNYLTKKFNNKQLGKFIINALVFLTIAILAFDFYQGWIDQNPHRIVPHYFFWEFK